MSDLEDDLLALAGGASDSDSYSPQASPKRVHEDLPPYPLEAKYKDWQDKAAIEAMDEMERERILFERSDEMEKYQERLYLLDRSRKAQKVASESDEEMTERTSRAKKVKDSAKSDKNAKLNELRKQREKKSRRDQARNDDDYSGEEESEDEYADGLQDDYEDEEYGAKPRRGGYDADKDVEWAGKSSYASRNLYKVDATLLDVKKIAVTRADFAKYCFHPGFKEVFQSCFAKVTVGFNKHTRTNEYRLVQIHEIVEDSSKPAYELEGNKVNRYVVASQGKSTKKFSMKYFSDSPVTEEDYAKYIRELNKAGEPLPNLGFVDDKFRQLREFSAKKMTAGEFDQMISSKQSFSKSKQALIAEKAILVDRRAVALEESDAALASDLAREIQEVDAKLKQVTTNHLSLNSLDAVNERNRRLNTSLIRRAEIANNDVKRKQQSNTSGVTSNPFHRLRTNTRIFYQEVAAEENEKAQQQAEQQAAENEAKKRLVAKLMEESRYRRLGVIEELIQGIDV
ncbi:hypothetical protein BABINDRAFT_6724 [Babjeviella inositovora NRRL Y-12698]|uniref:Plus3 domain-containing protein n=1 Tax=Babjeviella inositovora NRRL Y-12698 TaxID=984486 RepID=A0A1E3QWS7_9ASCO|nr:uncharacterized protein BABINDRAFT_6724 [Babjeviella inositovora NRRL Y-12698]ODQ82116.1 hypothetical protein BABINDRAFT_6724 [Babjeviella inositovora NRRL Y-12698]